MSDRHRRAWLLALALVTIGCDRVTKHAAATARGGLLMSWHFAREAAAPRCAS